MPALLLTLYAGFTHAFETDHLLAVSSIVTNRNRIRQAAKDGIFWGLGHSTTILCIGILMILLKLNISPNLFRYFEAGVGIMLIGLAGYRLWKFMARKEYATATQHTHNSDSAASHKHHRLAYGVGAIHGLAGSGALVLLVLSQVQTTGQGFFYLLLFGLGSIGGMLLAAVLFSIPFSKKILQTHLLRTILVLISAGLCIGYGGKVVYENLIAIP
jgi:hypothetical protein